MSPEALPAHRITPIGELEGVLPPTSNGRPRVERLAHIYPARVAIAPIAFGHQDLSGRSIAEHPRQGAWAEASYEAQGPIIRVLRDAIVRSDTGIVTMDGHVLAETLVHIPDHLLGGERLADGIAFAPNAGTHQLGRAAHLMGGGYDNYYHWMADIVARTTLAEAFGFGAVSLFGAFNKPFHASTAALLAPPGSPRIGLPPGVSVHVDELVYVPSVSGYGFEPHPCLVPAFDRLRAHAGTNKPSTRRLYISRIGSEHRPMLNEPEVAALLAMHGFETVQLDGMAVLDQVLLFAEASHIVAPHGAGLTNLLFCSPGTTLLELLPSHYVNWCFRRVASLRNIRYGCLVGETPEPWNEGWPHANAWTAPTAELAQLLRTEVFSAARSGTDP